MSESPYYKESWETRGAARIKGFSKSGFKRKPKTESPLPFVGHYSTNQSCSVVSGSPSISDGMWTDIPNSIVNASAQDLSYTQPALNRAYESFVEIVRGEFSSQMLTFIAEGNKSLGMAASRVQDMIQAIRTLKKGARSKNRRVRVNGYGFENSRRSRKERAAAAGKKASDWWLEWNFGWAPTIADIENAMMVISRDFNYRRPSPGSGFIAYNKALPTTNPVGTWQAAYSVRTNAAVKCVNPNLALADGLGLTSPQLTAFELVPFSFVADWAFSLSTSLGSWTDLFGYEITDAYWTVYGRGSGAALWTVSGGTAQNLYQSATVVRNIGLPKPMPNFNVLSNLRGSVKRLGHSLALLAQLRL